MIEVSSGEYGEHNEKMVAAIENGRRKRWIPPDMKQIGEEPGNTKLLKSQKSYFHAELKAEYFKRGSTFWQQFRILFCRKIVQDYRNPVSSF